MMQQEEEDVNDIACYELQAAHDAYWWLDLGGLEQSSIERTIDYLLGTSTYQVAQYLPKGDIWLITGRAMLQLAEAIPAVRYAKEHARLVPSSDPTIRGQYGYVAPKPKRRRRWSKQASSKSA